MEMLMLLDFERKQRAKRATAAAAQFPDLTVSSAEERRRRVFWQMPFRHNLYRDNNVKKAGMVLRRKFPNGQKSGYGIRH